MENDPLQAQLSSEQLQDIVTAAVASSALEAAYLSDTLDEAGIPVVTRNDNVQGLGGAVGAVRICVPRVKGDEARALVDKARRDAQQRGVENAFTEDGRDAALEDIEHDPVMEEMARLRDESPDERWAFLEARIVEWLGEGLTVNEIARYLGGAGLTLDEAERLLNDVKESHADLIHEKRGNTLSFGIALIVAGVAGHIVLFTILPIPFVGWFAWGAIAIGLAMTFFATRPLPTIEKSPAEPK
jgi:hypothetical protein